MPSGAVHPNMRSFSIAATPYGSRLAQLRCLAGMTDEGHGIMDRRQSLKFYESCAQLLRGVADGEAVLLGALFHMLGNGHAHGEGGNNEDGEDGERLLHDVQRALMRVPSAEAHHRRACLSSR